MLRIIHFLPNDCPYCGSSGEDKPGSISFGDNSRICGDCGALVESTGVNEGRDPTSCPHCRNVGDMGEYAGEEWCHVCGLDPNVTNYPSAKIAHLWKKGSGIARLMERDLPALSPHKRLGAFVRNMCGPRCEYAEVCPQSIKNFVVCNNEDWEASRTEDEMSKRRRKGKNKKGKHSRSTHSALHNPFKKEEAQPTLLICAKYGWFEETMNDKLTYRQQSGDKRGGSRT